LELLYKNKKMKIPVKYIILLFAFGAGSATYAGNNIGAGIAAAGAFIGYALIEIYDLKILNQEEEEG
jgi:hypothetical protein